MMHLKCKTYSSYEAFLNLKAKWPESENCFYENDFEYISFLYKENIEDGKLLSILLSDSDGKYFIINGLIEDVVYYPKFFYFTLKIIRFKKRCLRVFPYPILDGINDNFTAKSVEDTLITYCGKNNIDYISFALLSGESIFAKYLSMIKNPLKKDLTPLIEEHFLLEMPESLDGYFKTKDAKGRYNLKRILKQLDNTYKDKIFIRSFTSEEDVEVFCDHAELAAQKSHLRPLNVGFKSSPDLIKKKKFLAGMELFRSYILYIDENPSAFINGILYKRSYFTEHIGFDIAYERFSIGSYLLLRVIDDISSNKLADIIDYGYGSDPYKKRFSSLCHEDVRIRLFIPKISNIFFMINIAFFTTITNLTRKLLKKTGFYTKTRKAIRKFFLT